MQGLLSFPSLHPALAEDLPAGVRLLDPGLAEADAASFLRPGDLPLGPQELKGYLREFDRLRREVKNPKDLALLAGTSGGHFYSQTSFAVREALEDNLHPERVAARRTKAAQLTLCLAYLVEESLLELAGTGELDARFARAMAESLGLGPGDPDDPDEEVATILGASGALLPDAALIEEFRPPWRRILPAFWAIAPEGAGLFIADGEIVAELLDAGLALLAAPTERELAAWFPNGAPQAPLLAASLTGWRLLGKTRPDPEAPWLDTPRPIVVIKP